MIVSALIATTLIAIPPPVCRGKNFGTYDPRFNESPSERAIAEVQAAYEALCPGKDCGQGIIYKNEMIGDNALTFVSGLRDGQGTLATIVYSARFLDTLSARFGAGASFGVLAHEVGHHVTAAKSMRGLTDHSWDEELRADFLAGCALGRAGRPPEELEAAVRALASVSTPTHPAFDKRNPVIRKGYADCKKHQERFDSLPDQKRFGLGAALQTEAAPSGCWLYFYRSQEEIEQVGPVAAPRRRSKHYATKFECEEARTEMAKARSSEPCKCP
jgi:hypothetical protein